MFWILEFLYDIYYWCIDESRGIPLFVVIPDLFLNPKVFLGTKYPFEHDSQQSYSIL